jgi:hypothetical protein
MIHASNEMIHVDQPADGRGLKRLSRSSRKRRRKISADIGFSA